jgi:O-antigen/teichoic acid export membrane protein
VEVSTVDTGRHPPASSRRGVLPAPEAGFWVLFALAIPRLAGAIVTVAIRRYLGPGVAGSFDLAFTPYKFLDGFRNFGTGPALIYEEALEPAVANTAWSLNVLAAILVTGIAELLAGPIAHYYGHPEIEGILRVLALGYVFASISSVHSFLLLRDRNFRARSMPAIGQVAAAGGVTVVFALWGFGVGTLVARELASVVVGSIILWAIYPFRPHLQFVPSIGWRLLRYGIWVGTGLSILYISQNVDVVIGGRIIQNTSDIGFYTTSWSLAFIVAGTLAIAASSMVFPTLSRLQHDPPLLADRLLQATRQLGVFMLPSAALLAALAPVLIVPLLGGKWAHYRESFLVLSLLAIYAGNRTMLFIFFEGYKSVGKPWLVPIYNLIRLVVVVPAMIYGAQHGIMGLALTYIPIQLIEIPAALLLARRVLQIAPTAVWRALQTPILATLAMSAAVIAAEVVLRKDLHVRYLITLGVCAPLAGGVYVGALRLLDRGILSEVREVLLHGL